MAKLYNLARMSVASAPGTGSISLGSAIPGFLTFAQAGVADGQTVAYAIQDGLNSEHGVGVYTSASVSLTRVVTKSTNADAAINATASAQVFISPRKEDLANLLEVNSFSDTTDATSLVAASMILAGGLAITKKLRVGNGIFPGTDTFASVGAGSGGIYLNAGSGLTILAYNAASGNDMGFYSASGSELFVNPHGTSDLLFGRGGGTTNFGSLDASAAAGPLVHLFRDSVSPAVNDVLGQLHFSGNSSTGVKRSYAYFTTDLLSPTNGAETGQISLHAILAGADTPVQFWNGQTVTLVLTTDATSSTAAALVVSGGLALAKKLIGGSSILSVSPTAGVGYATGAGGTVTQITSKATAVTLNTITGLITMNNASLAAGTVVSFVLNDSAIAATDFIGVMHESGGTLGAYTVNGRATGAGTASIDVRNNTAGALGEALALRFVVIKSVNA